MKTLKQINNYIRDFILSKYIGFENDFKDQETMIKRISWDVNDFLRAESFSWFLPPKSKICIDVEVKPKLSCIVSVELENGQKWEPDENKT